MPGTFCYRHARSHTTRLFPALEAAEVRFFHPLNPLVPFQDRVLTHGWSVKVATEQRVQVSPTRVRIPDVMLVPRGPQPEVAVDPPVLVVEILSPDDTYTETQSRSADYLHMGVPCVWIIDPTSRTGRQCIGDAWTAADTLEVPGTKIQVNLLQLFADLDED